MIGKAEKTHLRGKYYCTSWSKVKLNWIWPNKNLLLLQISIKVVIQSIKTNSSLSRRQWRGFNLKSVSPNELQQQQSASLKSPNNDLFFADLARWLTQILLLCMPANKTLTNSRLKTFCTKTKDERFIIDCSSTTSTNAFVNVYLFYFKLWLPA